MVTNHPTGAAAARARQQGIWDRAAPGWERHRASLEAGDSAITDRLLTLTGIGPGQRVLDLACGTGDPAIVIAERVGAAGTVMGLDLSAAMVAAADAFARQRGLRNATFRRLDREGDLGVPDGAFDAATCRFGLMFFPDPTSALVAMRRALKPGGRVAVSTWGPMERVPYFALAAQIVRRHADLPPPDPPSLAMPEAVEALLREAGLVDTEAAKVEAVVLAAETPHAFWDTLTEVAGPLGAALTASQPHSTPPQ